MNADVTGRGAASGAGAFSSTALPVGFRLAEFEIERVLGEGGFGIVYLARDTQLGREVAVKEYMPSSLAGRQADLHVSVKTDRHRETFELGRRSFINEARLLAHFDHPALVKVLRFWEDRGTAYMAMPYYRGKTLKDTLREMPERPDEAWLRGLWEPMLDALAHLHAEHCFHRDIAPDNILLLPTGSPLLIDFGAARQVIGDATQALTVILKPGFAPVEQYAESAAMKQGAWTDVYALGAVMYHAISGRAPPPAVARLVSDEMEAAETLGKGRYSPSLLRCIDRCLAVRPGDRPQGAAQVQVLLRATSSDVSDQESPSGPENDERTVIVPIPSSMLSPSDAVGAPHLYDRHETNHESTVAMPSPVQTHSQATPALPGTSEVRWAHQARVPATNPSRLMMGAVAVVLAGALAWWWLRAPPNMETSVTTAVQAQAYPKDPVPPKPRLEEARPASPASTPVAVTPFQPPQSDVTEPPPGLIPPAADAEAALRRMVERRASGWEVLGQLAASRLVARRDALSLEVHSEGAGFVYVLQAGRHRGKVNVLYPTVEGATMPIEAGGTLKLPGPGDKFPVESVPGQFLLAVVVSEVPRSFPVGGPGHARGKMEASEASLWSGQAVCAGEPGCSERYGAVLLDYTVSPPARVEAKAGPARRPTDGGSPECAELLARLSMGDDTPALRQKMNHLNCR